MKKLFEDKNWLYQKYWNEKLSLMEIAMIFEPNDWYYLAEKIRKEMIKFGIKRRSSSEAHILQHIKMGHMTRKNRIKQKGEKLEELANSCPHPRESRQMLGVTAKQFAKLCDVSIRTVGRWESGEKKPLLAQKILILEVLKIAREF